MPRPAYQPTVTWGYYLGLSATIALAAAAAVILGMWQTMPVGAAGPPGVPFGVVGVALVALFPAAWLHELGHLAVGTLTGVRFVRVDVPPLSFVREPAAGWSVRWGMDLTGPGAAVWRDPGRPASRGAVVAMLLAGPAANVAVGAVFLAIAQWVIAPPGGGGWAVIQPADFTTAAANTVGLLNLALGFGSLIPCRAAHGPTDGLQVFTALDL